MTIKDKFILFLEVPLYRKMVMETIEIPFVLFFISINISLLIEIIKQIK